jgi:3-oxoacyl-[acyl-carrier protein] reductase
VVLDVNDAEAALQLVETLSKDLGGISILVNNAGVTQDQLAMRMKDAEWDAVISTNLTSVGRLSRAVLRGMMKAKHGRIINITSVVGSAGNPGQMNYAAAKAGVAQLRCARLHRHRHDTYTNRAASGSFAAADTGRTLRSA